MELYKLRDKWNGEPDTTSQYVPASPADLLAVVRRGVESGTIKGEVAKSSPVLPGGPDAWVYTGQPGTFIVIGPVSDDGSET